MTPRELAGPIRLAPDGPFAHPFEGQEVDEKTFLDVLGRTLTALRSAAIPYAAIGGLASASLGRSRWTHDIDLFLRDRLDATTALEAFERAGFATERTDDNWLYKAFADGVLVDLIFKAKGDIYLDEEMLQRTTTREFKGHMIPVVPPEDLIMIKTIVHDEPTPRHWFDALAVIAESDIDWGYLLRRSVRAPRRLMSLLLYAQSNDIIVPDRVIRDLYEAIYDA